MIYVVQPGDTLFIIAQRFNTTVETILSLNPKINNQDFIFPGQIIKINLAQPSQLCPNLYKGDRGPDVSRIQLLLRAAGFGPVTIDGIFGPKTQEALIEFQQMVMEADVTGFVNLETWVALGAVCKPFSKKIQYAIRPRETLNIIAARFSITVEDILQANPQITNANAIFAGQVINIPNR